MTDNLCYYSRLASKSLLYELDLSPKPGLVDRFDSGSHKDMDYTTFTESIAALSPFLDQYVVAGWHYYDDSPKVLFERLRQIGIKAEEAMFKATNGVNTHKGVNFSFALLLGATGAYLAQNPALAKNNAPLTSREITAICTLVRKMTLHLVESDLSHLESKKNLSHGEKLFLRYGIKGPRGEAADGFTTVREKALPFFKKELVKHKDEEFSQLRLLIYLMTVVEDGNIIHRGGIGSWEQIKNESRELLGRSLSKTELIKNLSNYNLELMKRYLSPGGSADLLSLTFYFAFLEQIL